MCHIFETLGSRLLLVRVKLMVYLYFRQTDNALMHFDIIKERGISLIFSETILARSQSWLQHLIISKGFVNTLYA